MVCKWAGSRDGRGVSHDKRAGSHVLKLCHMI